jgi:type IV secretory pathway TraG/TraD family ATPase VirD4
LRTNVQRTKFTGLSREPRRAGSTASLKGGSSSSGEGASWNEQRVRRDLLTPDEVMRLADHTMLVLRPSRDPLVAVKVRHDADREFAGLFDA